jgi:hypothetical protein
MHSLMNSNIVGIYYMSKLLKTSEIINTTNSRNNLLG